MKDILQEIVTGQREADDLVGAGLGVIRNGEPAVIAVDGLRKLGGDEAVTADDKWHVGSIGKSMTATMIARLVEAGHVKFGDRLGDLLSGYSMHEDWKRVSLEQLLAHRAGVVAHFPEEAHQEDRSVDDFSRTHERRQYWVKDMLSRERKTPPGGRFSYSNAGYGIAGLAVSEVMNSTWEQLMIDELFTPLRMASAGFGAPGGEQPLGHSCDKESGIKTPVHSDDKFSDNPPSCGPAGNMHLSLGDLLSFEYEQLRGRKGESNFLSTLTFSRLHTAYSNNWLCSLGWAVYRKPDLQGLVIGHAGSNTLWYAYAVVLPYYDLVVAFVTNDNRAGASGKTAEQTINKVLDRIVHG